MTRFATKFLCLLFLGTLGCSRPEGDRLVVVTPWSPSERAAIEKALHSPKPIAWVVLAPSDNAVDLVTRLHADVILGLSEHDCERLAASGKLLTIDPAEPRPWRVARTTNLGLGIRNGTDISSNIQGLFTFDDPRLDTASLAWAKSRVEVSGYGDIVRLAANASRTGRPNSALPALLRDDAAMAPATGPEGAIDDATHLDLYEDHPRYREGVAILAGTPHENEARELLTILNERGQAEPLDSPAPTAAEVGAETLLADLLGATLVDALDDLRDAALALKKPGLPPELPGYLNDPPPWPPASVAKLKSRNEPFPLLETLAREVSDDPEVQAWLMQSWDKPARSVDLAFLREMAGAASGKLLLEPRVRVWLRGEWSDWARQHYRRIAREAGRLGT